VKAVLYLMPRQAKPAWNTHVSRAWPAFKRGMQRHGVQVYTYVEDSNRATPPYGDVVVTMGWRKTRNPVVCGARNLVLDSGYVGARKGACVSFGWDGLSGMAQGIPPIPGRGKLLLGRDMVPWRGREVRNVLLAGQVPGDSALDGVGRYATWLRVVGGELRVAGYHVLYRPHPLAHGKIRRSRGKRRDSVRRLLGLSVSGKPLVDDLNWADMVVSWSSNTLVDAAIHGIPVCPFSRIAMVWGIRTPWGMFATPNLCDRDGWLDYVCSRQWNIPELLSGEAWDYIRQGVYM